MIDQYISHVQIGDEVYTIRDGNIANDDILTIQGTVNDTLIIGPKAVAVRPYILGVTGLSSSTPTLTRTYDNTGVNWGASNGVIEFTGLQMNKIWGGYCGNDGEPLTWSTSVNNFITEDGVAYNHNVFSVIKRFFVKPTYTTLNGTTVLEGIALAFTDSAPDSDWQDWFHGHSYIGVGCYKDRALSGSVALQSKRGRSLDTTTTTTADKIVSAYKLCSTTNGSLHEKWYNENSILQVLFMVLFGTRQTESVFPQATYRHYQSDTRATGYLDSMRANSSCATGYEASGSSGLRGNIFLGIEDFVGYGYELVAGLVYNGATSYISDAYSTFTNSTTGLPASTITRHAASNYIMGLRCDAAHPGLIIPVLTGGTESTYYCDYQWYTTGVLVLYQGAGYPYAYLGVFSFLGSTAPSYAHAYRAGRLCRTPA